MEPCIQETNIALIQQDTKDIRQDTTKILLILEGNGNDGLVTKVALNRQSINKMWWWVGAVSIALLGIAAYVIKVAVT